MEPLILIAEDEAEIADILIAYLARDGFRTVRAENGRVALDLHLALRPDLVLLDIKMPLVDGYEVLTELRRRGETPVIMVTALEEDIDKLLALRLGTDDYVVKPFNPQEVVARVRAVLRRTQGTGADRPLHIGAITVDPGAYVARVEGHDGTAARILDLTLTEFRLLAHMARAPQRAFGRAELLDACMPDSDALERTIDSHISNLRRKLDAAGTPGFFENVRGVGYRLAPLA
ncbi:MAG TPA: response regulator [Sphingobium sp.]|nr:response regulator [Sphingobium sp.]